MLDQVFHYTHTLSMRAAKAQASPRLCMDSLEPLLLNNEIHITMTCAESNNVSWITGASITHCCNLLSFKLTR